MSRTVLIHIDEAQRDSHVAYWISMYLKEMNIKTYFCNRETKSSMWEIVKPDIMLDCYFRMYGKEEFERKSKYTKFCMLPTEGAIFNTELRHLQFTHDVNDIERMKYLHKAFIWGQETLNTFKKSPCFSNTKLILTGSPQYDAYMTKNKKISQDHLGMMSMFKTINIFDGRNLMKHIDDFRNFHGHHYTKDRDVEDLYWYHVSAYRNMLDILSFINDKNDSSLSISWRPHQHEKHDNYDFLVKRFLNNKIQVGAGLPLFQWIKSLHAAIVCKSTGIIEMNANKVPVISIEKLIGDRLDDHMKMPDNRIPFIKFTWQPETLTDLYDLVKDSQKGLLPLIPNSKDQKELDYYSREFFGYPRQEPATYLIAKEISSIFEEESDFFFNKKREIISGDMIKAALEFVKVYSQYYLGRKERNHCFKFNNRSLLEDVGNQLTSYMRNK